MAATTIRLAPATRARLARLKSHGRETYDDLLNRLMALVPEGDEEGSYTEAFRVGLLEARLDVRRGRWTDHLALKRPLGL